LSICKSSIEEIHSRKGKFIWKNKKTTELTKSDAFDYISFEREALEQIKVDTVSIRENMDQTTFGLSFFRQEQLRSGSWKNNAELTTSRIGDNY